MTLEGDREDDAQQQPETCASGDCPAPLHLDLSSLASPEALEATRRRVRVEPVEPIDRLYRRFAARAFLVKELFSEEESRFLLDGLSAKSTLVPQLYSVDYRRCSRAALSSPQLAALLLERLAPIIEAEVPGISVGRENHAIQHPLGEPEVEAPPELQLGYDFDGVWKPEALNECFRFCRYEEGGFFRAHCDAGFRRSDDERSLFTCMLYLDGAAEGGRTRFLSLDWEATIDGQLRAAPESAVLAEIAPEPGLCVLFFHKGLVHEGEDVRGGPKHILRTDLLFRRLPGTKAPRTEAQERGWAALLEAQQAEARVELDLACQLYRKAFKLDPKLEKLV